MIRIYRSPRVLHLLPLGFSAGLPLLLSSTTLGAWMTSAGVALPTVGLLSLVGLPYAGKFLWAPLLDRYHLPGLGRRRGWMLLFQVLCALALLALGCAAPGRAPGRAAALALLLAFFSASLDVVVDAYRADVLHPEERAAGGATYVLGYRAAMVVAGAAALLLSERLSFGAVYWLMAGLLLLGLPLTALAREPAEERPPGTIAEAALGALRGLLALPGAPAVLAGVLLYKLGDVVLLGMIVPFLLQAGFSRAEVGLLYNGLGLIGTIVGALAGGVLGALLGRRRSLLLFGAAQALANLGYAAVAVLPRSAPLLGAVVIVDHLCGGLAATALVAWLMSLCERRHSATQYALLTGLAGIAGKLLGAGAGQLALMLGWPRFFIATVLLGLPGLLLVGSGPGQRARMAGPSQVRGPHSRR